MKNGTLIKQRDITDCGAACLTSIAGYYDLQLPVAKIRQIAGTDKKGTNALGMIEAAEKLGFSAKGVRGDIEAIPEIPVPTIAHVIIKEVLHHYVVIYETSRSHVKIMDPGTGKLETYDLEAFQKIWSGVLILLSPSDHFEKGNQRVSTISRFSFLLKPHKAFIIQSVVGAVVFTLIGLTSAIYVQKILDFILPSGNTNLLNLLSVGMLFLLLLQILVNVFKSIFILKTGQQLDAKLILGYYKHILSLPQRFFDTMRVGEIISRINDAVKIRAFINEVGIDLLVNVLIVLFSFGLMFTYYWKLAVIILLVVPFYAMVYWLSNLLNKKVERKVMENAAELEAQLVESINNIRTIKSFGMQGHANLKTEFRFVNLLSSVYKSGMNGIFSGNASLTISRAFTIILLWIGATYVMGQSITAGELMSFYAIIGYFTGPVSNLIGANKNYQNAKIAADRLFEIMDLEGSDEDDKLEMLPEEIGDIHFKDVKFRYGTRVEVFDQLTLTLRKGELTAIAGASGSGKSTLTSIIKRLYPVESGKVLIGRCNLNEIRTDNLDQLITMVPQQIDLFSGTVLENIALGEFQPDTQRIMELAEEIGALDFINDLPGGLNSQIGENGLTLSGGQRQRLAILRALYPEPQVILFDEATSALDNQSEDLVIQTMQRQVQKGKTVISVTHRMATAEAADRVILLEKGEIVADGSHQSLLDTAKIYKDFWSK